MTTTRRSTDLPLYQLPKPVTETAPLPRVGLGTGQTATPTPAGSTAATPAPTTTPAPETGVSSVTSSATPPDQHMVGQSATDAQQRAIIDQALREMQTDNSDDLSQLRDQIQAQINRHRQERAVIQAEKARVAKALADLMALPAGAKLVPPFLPADVLAKQAAPGTTPKEFEIDGQKLTLPPEIYNAVGFEKALASLAAVRALAPTTGGAQGCGSGVTNELVNNAFQFLATEAILRKDNGSAYGANANMDYSEFVKQLEAYGISATSNQEDGVVGGSVTLEGGRKVNDGVSDGNLDFKDMEWTKASDALAGALGVSATDLNINKEEFDSDYSQISSLLSDSNFNPADNDVLVEVLMIASVLEKAGVAIDGALATRSDLERYMAKLNTQDTVTGKSIESLSAQLTRVMEGIKEGWRIIDFARLDAPAPGSNQSSGSNRSQGTSNASQTGRGSTSGAGLRAGSLTSGASSLTGSNSPQPTTQTATSATAAEGVSFVREQATLLATALRDEHRLKMKLLDVDLGPQTPGSLARNQADAWNTLGELRSINMDRKLPVMRELASYIARNRDVLDGMLPQGAAVAAPAGRGSDRNR